MTIRPRRLRRNGTIRDLVAETTLSPDSLVQPMFVVEGEGRKEEIASMPGQFRFSVDELLAELGSCVALGIRAILLFGIPDRKDEVASAAYDEDGIVQRAVRAVKAKFPELCVVTDVCLCEYTSHGHCGLLRGNDVDNDPTLEFRGIDQQLDKAIDVILEQMRDRQPLPKTPAPRTLHDLGVD